MGGCRELLMKILEGRFCGGGYCDYPDPMISTGDVFVDGGLGDECGEE